MTIVPPDSPFRQRVVWIALPNGRRFDDRDPRFLLSVFVAPQLLTEDPATLADFPDWIDWSATGVELEVYLDDELVDSRPESAPSENLWPRLLPLTTRVRGYRSDVLSTAPVLSYGMAAVEQVVEVAYGQLMANESMPSPNDLITNYFPDLVPIVRGRDLYADAVDRVRSKAAEGGVVVPSDLDVAENFVAAKEFHRSKGSAAGSPRLPRPPERPDPDFHEILTLLGEHGELMRRLGLVRDLSIPARAVRGGTGRLRVRPAWEPVLPTVDVCPSTLTELLPFRTAPRLTGSDHVPGYLAVGTDRYTTTQIDADGAVEKLLSFAGDAMRTNGARARLAPRETVPPAQRSAGLQLVRHDRAQQLKHELSGAETIAALLEDGDDSVVLGAEDITRGVRPDIRMDGGPWRSLVQRHAVYSVDGQEEFELDEEGTVSSTLAGDPGDPEERVRVGESIVQWTGWSLAVERPGTPVSVDEFPGEDGYPQTDRSPLDGVPLSVLTEPVPGSLPPLRYGHAYEMRVRTVDLAGNSVPFDAPTAGDAIVTTPVVYRRIEPLESPADVATSPRTPGDQGDTLVVRTSDFDGEHENTERADRLLYPPKGAVLLAETHGELDAPTGVPRSELYHEIATRESNTFTQEFDPATGGLVDRPGVHREDAAAKGALWLEDPPAEAPYLPDPIARGVALNGFPSPGLDQVVPFSGTWPRLAPVRLLVRRGDDDLDVAQSTGFVEVNLPLGAVRRIRLSTAPVPESADVLAPLQWGITHADADPDVLRARVLDGTARLVTPHRYVRLVHAVRQPVLEPDFTLLRADRAGAGATRVELSGTVRIHGRTTRHVDVLATWKDPVDDGPGSPPPGERRFEDVPAGTIVPVAASDSLRFQAGYELGDTRHHAVRYRAIATSPFGDYFTRTETRTFGATLELEHLGHGIIPESVRVRSADGTTTYAPGVDYRIAEPSRADLGVVPLERIEGGAISNGQQVRVSWLPGPVTREGAGTEIVHVPSSARPSAPSVQYLMPAFSWSSTQGNGSVTSERRGNILRVFLDRPWWSSGEGELLGVVLPMATLSTGGVLPEDAPFVTQLGIDPTVVGPAPTLPLLVGDFPRSADGGVRVGVHLPERGDDVAIVGHEVAFDADRDCYFCDIEIDAGETYFPFVRLALARYQPHAIDGMHLSAVVMADFMQLSPRRSATVTRTSSTRVTVDLYGPSYQERRDDLHHGIARVILERLHYPGAGDAGWEEVGRSPLTATANGSTVRWSGGITVPATGLGDHRLVIEQAEEFRTAGEPSREPDKAWPSGERVVHQDIIRQIPPPQLVTRPSPGSRPIPVTTFVQNLFETLSQILRR